MSPHQIIAVAVRLFAIWLFALVAINGTYYFQLTRQQGESDSVLVFMVGAILVILMAIGLWRFPLTIAKKLLSSNTQNPASEEQPDLWLAMGCALMGLWMLSSSIPSFVYDLTLARSDYAAGFSDTMNVRLGLYLPKTMIGLWLIFGGKGFRKLFWWVRNAGRRHPQPRTPNESPD